MNNDKEIKYKECALLYCRIDSYYIGTTFNKLLMDTSKVRISFKSKLFQLLSIISTKKKKKSNWKSFYKLFQIMSLKNNYFNSDETSSKLMSYISESFKHKTLDLMDFFKKAKI